MEVLTEMDEYFNAMQKINMDEPVMPYVKGRLVESTTYNKLRKIMETPELEKAHPYCYDLDPEQLEDCDVAKINNLYQLGVDRGFIEDDFQYQDPEDAECCDGVCQDTPDEEVPPVPTNPRAKIPCFVAMYSAMKDGQIKTGEAYSRAISVQAAKADVIAQLSRFGYSNISILAIEATEEDACGCTLNEGNLGKYVGAGLGAFGGAAMGAGLGSNFGSDIATGIGGVTGAIGGGWLGSKIGDEAGENVDIDADVKFGKDARSSGPKKRRTKPTSESEDEEAPAEENADKKEDKSEEPVEESPAEEKPKKKAKKAKSKKEPVEEAPAEEEPAEEPVEEAPAEEEPADDGADDMFGLAGDEGSTDDGEADNQTDDSNIEADTGNDVESADANQEENSDGTQEKAPASNDEQPANEPPEESPAEEAPAEEEPAEEENDKEEELDPNKKAELKDNYKKIFKNTMLKCKFEDRSFDDLTLKEKVKFFTELAKTWKEGYEPPAFMSDKEVDQLEKTVVKKQ